MQTTSWTHTDILGAVSILWPMRWAGWGLGPDPLGPPSGPSCITQTCSHPAAHFPFIVCRFICVRYWGGVEMSSPRSGSTLMDSNLKYTLAGVEPVLIGTQRERLDRHYAGKCTCSVFCDIYFGMGCLEICDYTDADPH